MKPFCLYFLSSLFLLSFSPICPAQNKAKSPSPSGDKPNIIFILVDDMGWGDLGVFYQEERANKKDPKQPAYLTPGLSKLAKEGVQLRQHYSASPVCAPARASLLLGVHQGHSRVVRDNTFDMPIENTHTIASVLKQAGYATAVVGKWGVGGGLERAGDYATSSAYPTKRGFDFFFGYMDHISGHCHYPPTDAQHGPDKKNAVFETYGDKERELSADCVGAYSTDLFTARAKKWITDQRKESPKKPFFLYLAYTAPHAALQVPTQAYPKGGGKSGGVQWIGKKDNIINTANKEKIDSFIYPEFVSAKWQNREGKLVTWPAFAQRHATMIRRVDDAVSDIRQLLKDLKIYDNTLIVFASDNGPHDEAGVGGKWTQNPQFFRSYGPFDGIKRDTLEGGLRVPALVSWPRYTSKGKISHQAGQFHDWLATFADAAGIPQPASTDGVSLLPTITGQGTQKQGVIYTEYCFFGKTPAFPDFDESHRNAIRRQEQVIHVDGYKGVRYNIENHSDTDFRIHDVINDPGERINLATKPEFSELQAKMKNRALQVRRSYDYFNATRGKLASRPYDNEFVPSVTEDAVEPGVLYAISFGKFPWVPRFDSSMTINSAGKSDSIKPQLLPQTQAGAIEFSGFINIPEEGDYTFYLTTDSSKGSKAFLRLHDMQLVDADNTYTPGERVDSSSAVATTEKKEKTGKASSVKLSKGLHPYRLTYVHAKGSTPKLKWEWKQGENGEIKAVPSSILLRNKKN